MKFFNFLFLHSLFIFFGRTKYANPILVECVYTDKSLICPSEDADLDSPQSYIRIRIYDQEENLLSKWILKENDLQEESMEIF